MASSETQRRLAAILSADVAGYSRLMGADEAGTVETLAAFRKVFLAHIASHRGRVVDAKGDALLAEFASVVDAVNAAVDIQRELTGRNAELPDAQRMDWRIGVNLGDVIARDDSIYGDGVNIAARLESLAEPGGVCISGSAYAQVRGKLALDYRFLGRKKVKNIAEPVPVYRVGLEAGAGKARAPGRRKWIVAAIAGVALVAVSLGGYFGWRSSGPGEEKITLTLPSKPSIAVLPFDNLSGNAKDDWFSDGITETITGDLAKIKGLFVIARNSAFAYKGQAMDLRQVGRELGVRYLLEGSVQKSADRVRITAQLIEAATGNHLWSERYDRKLQELFALQDEIAEKIVSMLEVELTMDDMTRVRRRTTENLEAWEHYARGMKEYEKNTPTSIGIFARVEFEKALHLDPEFQAASLGLGWVCLYGYKITRNYADYRCTDIKKAAEFGRAALSIDDDAPEPYALLGQIHLSQGLHDQAIRFAKRAVELNPNGADWHAYLGEVLALLGSGEEALKEVEVALRLNPSRPDRYLYTLGLSNYVRGAYGKAIPPLEKILARGSTSSFARQPGFSAHLRINVRSRMLLIASYSASDRMNKAKVMANEYLAPWPHTYMTEFVQGRFLFKNPEDSRRLINHLVQAGFPE